MQRIHSQNDASRAVVIVLDGVGVGALPDADLYGDAGTNSLMHAAAARGGLRLPVLGRMGLGNIVPVTGVPASDLPRAGWGKMAEQSPGKDSVSGHWELMGCPLEDPFPLFPNGFPDEVIGAFQQRTGLGILGNKPASGTEIIEELGQQHLRTGHPIVYTSADSVFQVAAHERVIDRHELYRICDHARAVLTGPYRVARVIARPFRGEPGRFVRTEGRRDFTAPPPEETLLDLLSGSGRRVVTIGKIHDLFSCRGIDEIVPAAGNEETMRLAADFIAGGGAFSFLFINLIDFDMLWGHRRDIERYASGLERFDAWFGGFIRLLGHGVLLAVTSDHGCDPAAPGSDHTREYVPILALLTGQGRGVSLGTRGTFSDLAATVAGFFGIRTARGESFLELVG